MSVYTRVEKDELERFLSAYDIGELVGYRGIDAGIENTNYFVSTRQEQLVLTLFEQLTAQELPYFLDVMANFAEHGIPSAHPVADRSGHYLRTLNGKPAALVKRLTGASAMNPNAEQCAAIGRALANMHRVGGDAPTHRANNRGPEWWRSTLQKLQPVLASDDAGLLREELDFQSRCCSDDLPKGIIHADLFRDNALFEGDTLVGIIDFYYACNDLLLYDVAVTANDWCSDDEGRFIQPRLTALLAAYQQVRPFTAAERNVWVTMLRAAALRFWLSRLYDLHFPRQGELTHTKEPDVFKRILLQRRQRSAL